MLNTSLPDQFPILTLNPDAQPFQERSLSDFLDQTILKTTPATESKNSDEIWGSDPSSSRTWGNSEKVKRNPSKKTPNPHHNNVNHTKRSPNLSRANVLNSPMTTSSKPSHPLPSRHHRDPRFNSFSSRNPTFMSGHNHSRNADKVHLKDSQQYSLQSQQNSEDIINTVVFVKGLKYTVNRKEIFSHFSSCGNILDIELPMCRRRRGRSRGICWITFERPPNVEKALRLDGTAFQDREIRVFLAKSARAQNHGNRTTLFVWGLPPHIGDLDLAKKEITRTQLEAMFLFAGEIKSIRIPKPSIRGPIAFVEFYEPDDALYGLCLDGRVFHGSTIRVEFARNAR